MDMINTLAQAATGDAENASMAGVGLGFRDEGRVDDDPHRDLFTGRAGGVR